MTRLRAVLRRHAGWTLVNGDGRVSVDEALSHWQEETADWEGPAVETVVVPGHPEMVGLVATGDGAAGMWLGFLVRLPAGAVLPDEPAG